MTVWQTLLLMGASFLVGYIFGRWPLCGAEDGWHER